VCVNFFFVLIYHGVQLFSKNPLGRGEGVPAIHLRKIK
jgi:hypothetical protein